MSARLDIEEFLSAYLAEVDEHLVLSSTKLLAIEADARKGESSPRAVREVFRALHTVKGLSAMVGVEPVVAIAHRMETALREADRAGGKLDPEAANTLLQGVRAIEHRVRELADGKSVTAPPTALLDALDALEPSQATASTLPIPVLDLEPTLLGKLAPYEVEMLLAAVRAGRRTLRAAFAPSPAKAEKGLSITTIRERVSLVAEIVKVVPVSVAATADAPGGLSFVLLLITDAANGAVAAAMGIAVDEVFSIYDVSAAPAPSEPPLPFVADDDIDDVRAVESNRRNVLRVDVARLDDAMERLAALIVTRSRLVRAVAALTAAGAPTRDLVQVVQENARQLRDLRGALLRVRMLPMTEVLERVPLLVRGLARESGKRVRLTVEAGSTELDKAVADRIFPAIVHLIRNAVDHAIEAPGERTRSGKREEATLRIGCGGDSNTRLELTVSDDGRGISRASVARKLGREIAPGDASLLDAICAPGMSTREEVTTTSGRGLGMDIVRRIVVEQLGGELVMKTEEGVGTTFILRVPLTISIVDAFVLECADERFIVPVSMVEEILEIDPANIQHQRGGGPGARYVGLLMRRGEAVPLVDLGVALRLERTKGAMRQAVVVRRSGFPVAFGIDRVTSQQEAVVRPLGDPLVQASGISGATDLGDGKPTLVLDLVALAAAIVSREGGRAA